MQNLNRNPNPQRRASLGRALSGLTLVSTLIGGLSFTSPAAQAPPERTGPPNRWLIIVDTSRPMEPRAENARQIAGILVLSGMNGQMRRGDTVGLWTFNQDLYAGTFPLQDFKPETARTTAQRVIAFLEEQKNEKSSHLEKVMPELGRLVKGSEFITVIIISDGSSKIIGTPFDDKINATFDAWRSQQKKSQMPFLTLLRAKRGQFTDYVVNTPPWQLDLPPLPNELLSPAPTPKPAGIRVPSEPAKPPVGNLIVSGKNSTPAPDPSLIVVTANSNDPTSNPTNPPIVARVVPIQPAKAEQHAPATPSGVMPVMAAEISKSNAPASAPAAGSPPPTGLVATALAAAAPTASSTPPAPTDTHPVAQDDSYSAKPEVPAQTAMSVFSGDIFSPRNLFIVVGVLIALMFILMALRTRQPESPTRISLITRSLDQEQQ